MSSPTRPAAIVLAGGASRRMGQDKAALSWGRTTLLQRVVDQLAGVCKPILVVGAPAGGLPSLRGEVQAVPDPQSRRGQGPLPAIATGLTHLPVEGQAIVLTCDNPFVGPVVVSALLDGIGTHKAAAFTADARLHPFPCLLDRQAAAAAAAALRQRGVLRATALLEALDCAALPVPDETIALALAPCNTPAQYEALLRRAR